MEACRWGGVCQVKQEVGIREFPAKEAQVRPRLSEEGEEVSEKVRGDELQIGLGPIRALRSQEGLTLKARK